MLMVPDMHKTTERIIVLLNNVLRCAAFWGRGERKGPAA